MKLAWMLGWMAGAAWSLAAAGEWAAVPPQDTRTGRAGGWDMGRLEVTVGDFAAYLNAAGGDGFPETAQIAKRRTGGYTARRGTSRQAVSEVTAAEAEAYARWRSRQAGRTIRLPTGAEWEISARGGVEGAPFPWGWGGRPERMARFDASGPARKGGLFPPNGFGLYDMAGNLYEWCARESGDPPGQRLARGGGWPERNPSVLRVDRGMPFPEDYRGPDAGFRLLREWKKTE